MAALPERKIAIVRTLVETAPERILLSLQQALEGTEDESSLGGVRKLVDVEIADRALRDAIFEPVVRLFNAASREPRRLTFPPRALNLMWRALCEIEAPAIDAARAAREARNPNHSLISKYDTLVAVAANGLRGTGGPGFQTAADLCDQVRPGGARLLVGCLDIAPVVRRCTERLPVWIAHPGGDTAAATRLAYNDAVEVADDAGPRFFAMIAAQLAHPWMVLRVISAVMDRPTERYMADSELAAFAEVLLAVAVGVEPDPVTQRREFVETGIDGAAVLTRRQPLHIGNQAVAVQADVTTHLSWTAAVVSRRLHKPNLVVSARGQALEAVVATGVGGASGQYFVGIIEVAVAIDVAYQFDARTGDAQVTCILYAIGIFVFKDAVAHFGGPNFDQRGLLLIAAAITHIKHQPQDLTGVGLEAIVCKGLPAQRADAGRIGIAQGL